MFKKSTTATVVFLFVIALITGCDSKTDKEKSAQDQITPVELASYVEGFNFPEDSNTVTEWANNNDSTKIFEHAWGLWAGLTEPTNQIYAEDSLLVFETWQGIDEIRDNIRKDSLNSGCTGGNSRSSRTKLSRPHQFTRKGGTERMAFSHSTPGGIDKTAGDDAHFWVTVSYSPDAACFATKQQILRQSVLDKYKVTNGIGRIPDFPQKSVTIKPTYFVGEEKDNLIRITVVTQAAPDSGTWGGKFWPKTMCVYADVKNTQPKNKHLVPADTSDISSTGILAATCNLSDFIYFKVDDKMAAHMNKVDSLEKISAKAGQIAILVAMHVSTKETKSWTWQTFYWAPDPNNVYSPSSALAASLRPKGLKGAAGHYALNAGYAMVIPNQPFTGGTNIGVKVLYSYNPYLEAGFSGLGPAPDSTFQMASPLIKGNPYGVQTNCMTCHAMATSDSKRFYLTDQYIDMNDIKLFKNKVQLDFAWSIQGNMIPETDIALKKDYIKKLAINSKAKN